MSERDKAPSAEAMSMSRRAWSPLTKIRRVEDLALLFDAFAAARQREVVELSEWQWNRIGACVRHARALMEDDTFQMFIGMVDEDPKGGMRADPRNPCNFPEAAPASEEPDKAQPDSVRAESETT